MSPVQWDSSQIRVRVFQGDSLFGAWNRGTPSHHSFIGGIFQEINQPAYPHAHDYGFSQCLRHIWAQSSQMFQSDVPVRSSAIAPKYHMICLSISTQNISITPSHWPTEKHIGDTSMFETHVTHLPIGNSNMACWKMDHFSVDFPACQGWLKPEGIMFDDYEKIITSFNMFQYVYICFNGWIVAINPSIFIHRLYKKKHAWDTSESRSLQLEDSIFDVQHSCAHLLGFARPGLRRAAQVTLSSKGWLEGCTRLGKEWP